MENTFEIVETSSSSEESEIEQDEITHPTKFLNEFPMNEYEKNRNELFTKNIIRKKIVVDSQSYYSGQTNFNTSDYEVLFDIERDAALDGFPTTIVTTNYGIYHNVIGFRLSKAMIRVPTYNINKTNNVIKYKLGFGDGFTPGTAIYSVTINPGVYNAYELAAVFQKYAGAHTGELEDDGVTPKTFNVNKNSHFCVYSDADVTTGSYNSGTGVFTPDPKSFTCTFKESNSEDLFEDTSNSLYRGNVTDYYRGMIYEFQFGHSSSPDDVTVIWNNDNVTRGAAKVFGFLPQTKSMNSFEPTIGSSATANNNLCFFSDKVPDLSTQFVDLVIPEIPSIACKQNSSGKDIVERIQLNAPHGDYVYYQPTLDEAEIQSFFSPKRLFKLTIQLYAPNGELYDTQNSDNSFEFEITMVKNKRLLS